MCSEGGGVYTAAEIVQGGHSGGKCALWGDTAAESVHCRGDTTAESVYYGVYMVAESVHCRGDTTAESVHYAIYTVAESVQGHGDGKCTQKR